MIFEKQKILIVDDEAPIRETLGDALRDEGHRVWTAVDGSSGLLEIKNSQPDIVFLDIWMPGGMDGIELLSQYKEKHKDQFSGPDFIVMSGHGTIETAVKATKLGAWDFIEKPLSIDKISIAIANVSSFRKTRNEKKALLNKLRKNIAMVGNGKSMMKIKQLVTWVASTSNWVLICGSEGSGKKLLAQNIHYLSSKAGGSFIEFSCATVPPELLLGELFGYESPEVPEKIIPSAGGYRKGKVELAHGGTLYLNHVEHLSLEAQDKFIEILKEGNVDIRLVAATTKDLQELVDKGLFRESLYQRLKLTVLSLPCLKDRKEDIPVLTSHFNDIFCRSSGFLRKTFSEAALEELSKHTWTGNVRELKNFIERVYILTPSEHIDVHDIRFAGLSSTNSITIEGQPFEPGEFATFREARAAFEKSYIIEKIKDNGGNISKTAEAIGLERSYLHRKIKGYGIDNDEG